MNKNPHEITTKIDKDGILTIDLANGKSDYLKCQTCLRYIQAEGTEGHVFFHAPTIGTIRQTHVAPQN